MIKTRAVVIGSMPYRSQSAIVRLLCPWGKASAILKGLGAKNSLVSHAEIQTGNILNLELEEPTKNSELYTIRECFLLPLDHPTPLSALQNTELSMICELTCICLEHSQADGVLYEFMEQCVESLKSESVDFISLRYAFGLACCLGFAPPTMHSGYFDMQQGEFSVLKPFHPYYLTKNNAALFYSLSDTDIPVPIKDKDDYQKLWHIVMTYFGIHVSGFRVPRSLEFLKELTILERF